MGSNDLTDTSHKVAIRSEAAAGEQTFELCNDPVQLFD